MGLRLGGAHAQRVAGIEPEGMEALIRKSMRELDSLLLLAMSKSRRGSAFLARSWARQMSAIASPPRAKAV